MGSSFSGPAKALRAKAKRRMRILTAGILHDPVRDQRAREGNSCVPEKQGRRGQPISLPSCYSLI